jgi:hypothetical protein
VHFLWQAVGRARSACLVYGSKRIITGVFPFNDRCIKVQRARGSARDTKIFSVCTRRAFAFGRYDFIYTPLAGSFVVTLPTNQYDDDEQKTLQQAI